jgi:hypothetical protein
MLERSRKFDNEELHTLYSSSNIIRMITSRRIRWKRHVELTGEKRNAHRDLAGRPERKRPLERPWHRWEDNIKWILEEQDAVGWTGLIWRRRGTSGRLREYCNEISDFMKCSKIPE